MDITRSLPFVHYEYSLALVVVWEAYRIAALRKNAGVPKPNH
ncbi:MAG: hypothetical protein ABR543_04400 [Gemmatimonadaceae bacterium]